MPNFIKQLLVTFLFLGCLSHYAIAETFWVDVRSAEEYAEDHIAGDLNIDVKNISSDIGKYISDKNADIKLYCRSGRRAGVAMEQLQTMGYTHVSNVGGIDDARAIRKSE